MKKILTLVFVTTLLTGIVQAQVKKGEVVLGTNLNINSTINNSVLIGNGSNMLRNTQVQLEAGKAVFDNRLLGIRLGMGAVPGTDNSIINGKELKTYQNNRFVSATLFYRNYVPLNKKLSLFYEYTLVGTSGRFKKNGYDDSARAYFASLKLKNAGIGLSLGMSYHLGNRFMFDFSFNNLLGLRYSSTSGSSTDVLTGQVKQENASKFTFDPFSGEKINASVGIKFRLKK